MLGTKHGPEFGKHMHWCVSNTWLGSAQPQQPGPSICAVVWGWADIGPNYHLSVVLRALNCHGNKSANLIFPKVKTPYAQH